MKLTKEERRNLEEEIWAKYSEDFRKHLGTTPYKTFQKKRIIQIAIDVMQEKL